MLYPETILENGIKAPKAHQRIIGKLMASLGHLFYHLHQIELEPLPETQIDEGQSSPEPDIMLYNNKTFQTPIIIEVCHPNGINNNFKKLLDLLTLMTSVLKKVLSTTMSADSGLSIKKGLGQ